MKKLLFLLLLSPIIGLAQQKYFTYRHNGLYGITDVQGNDIVKAIYSKWEDYNTIDSLAILENKNGKTLVFHLYNGSKKEYDRFLPNHVYIQDEYFAFINNNKKEYLQGQISGLQIPLKEKFYEFKNLGPDYIVAKFEKIPKPVKQAPAPAPKKDKNGLTPPQIVREPQMESLKRNNYYVFKNDKKLVKLKEIGSNEFDFPFHIYDNTAATDGGSEQYSYKEDVKPWDHFYREQFDYVAVKDGDAFDLYDKSWKRITNIKSTRSPYDYDELISKALYDQEKDKEKRFAIRTANYAVPPSGWSRRPDFLKVEKQSDMNVVSIYKKEQYAFLFKTPSEVKVSDNEITIKSGGDSSTCVISKSAPALHLPTQYIQLYKVDFAK